MRHSRRITLSATIGLGIAAALGGVVPTATAANAPAGNPASYAAYERSAENQAANSAFFEAVKRSVAEQRAANPGLAAVTVTYNTRNAPSFRSVIARSTQIWNSSVSNVKLQEVSSGGNFSYYEGNDSRGSYASTDGHGRGYIFLDYAQNQQYNSTRVTAHETGHVLGLPDHYSGPCSELMSGGGPGTSCTNPNPNSAERSRVNQLWANGLVASGMDTKG
ncbi:snapalysin [Streptomyces lavendulae]|uniref:Extracellular small neutral protease n=1 Tax=Streptomyces lavendulae subsp. lavendulae TaxID=58340 RepID=A0A2K8PFJ9_STRLA|nr:MULTISPECIES: snapalysin [Streptomyces]GLX35507.1 extracellular small neutral protease [Streptomyces roseochromogenus]ATZ24523.1 Extracellular small neutral protease precursor [Streptomyces lavendulae subsp. lavendulae]MDH6540625.1 snapalysin [Streptomyces sp. SPB4]QUQ54353.1 Extracellular small neutral protease [Streptomyces lavendulae subsp. lavendulae]GLV80902.1 extracellular small neutral protease [Streptomyces lavendulae subsp. lavendulae]